MIVRALLSPWFHYDNSTGCVNTKSALCLLYPAVKLTVCPSSVGVCTGTRVVRFTTAGTDLHQKLDKPYDRSCISFVIIQHGQGTVTVIIAWGAQETLQRGSDLASVDHGRVVPQRKSQMLPLHRHALACRTDTRRSKAASDTSSSFPAISMMQLGSCYNYVASDKQMSGGARHGPRKQHLYNIDPTYQVNQSPLTQDAPCQGVKAMMVQDTFCLNARMQI